MAALFRSSQALPRCYCSQGGHHCTAPTTPWHAAALQAQHNSRPRQIRHAGSMQAVSSDREPRIQSPYDFDAPVQPSASEDFGYLQEYAALKQQLLDNTRTSGGAIGLYLLFTVNGTAALLAMLGTAASYAYFSLLCRDVDNVKGTDTVPIWEANKIENPWLRKAAKVKAAYQKALQPRLLVPVALGCLIGIYGRVTGEPLDVLYSGCLLLGFLSYKGALVVKLVDDLTPKSFGPAAERPVIEKFEDDLDQWGRPKKKQASPIDVMPEDQQQKAYEQLEKQMEKEERRARE